MEKKKTETNKMRCPKQVKTHTAHSRTLRTRNKKITNNNSNNKKKKKKTILSEKRTREK